MSVRVKHINDDATYLITFSIPEDSNIPYKQLQEFTILTDPWIAGSWHLLHPKVVFSKPATQACVESLAELDPPPNVVVVSQDKADHCHEKSLKQLKADLPGTIIYAQSGAAKKIKSWRYFPSEKIHTFSRFDANNPEGSLVRFSIPAAEDMYRYPGIIPGELTMAFMEPKFDMAGVHNGIGFTYRPPMFTDLKTGVSPSLPFLIPVKSHKETTRSRTNSTRTSTNFSRPDLGLGLKVTSTWLSPSRSPALIPTSPYQFHASTLSTPPDSPSQSTTTIETRTTATEYSTHETQNYDSIPLPPEWILPPTPTLRPKITPQSTSSSLHRLKTALSTPDLHGQSRTPKKKKSLNLRQHRRMHSSDQPLTITTPYMYTTDPNAPPLPSTPLSPYYPLTPTMGLPTQRPLTPFSPTSTIAGPKTISILYVPHGIPYATLEPWITGHLISTAALPLTLLLHPFDSVRNLRILGGQVINGGQHGAEIAKALMAKQWISTHDGPKIEQGWLVKKCVKRVFSKDEVDQILGVEHGAHWDYRRALDREKPRTGLQVLRSGEEIVLSV